MASSSSSSRRTFSRWTALRFLIWRRGKGLRSLKAMPVSFLEEEEEEEKEPERPHCGPSKEQAQMCHRRETLTFPPLWIF